MNKVITKRGKVITYRIQIMIIQQKWFSGRQDPPHDVHIHNKNLLSIMKRIINVFSFVYVCFYKGSLNCLLLTTYDIEERMR